MKNIFLVAFNWPEILIYTVIGICGLVAISMFLAAFIKIKKEDFKVDKSPSTLSVTINLHDNMVSVFSKKKLNGVKNLSIDEYLEFFSKNSKEKIKEFLDKIKMNVTDEFLKILELNAYSITRNNKKLYFSVFYITSVNLQEGIVHGTQYFYDNIPVLDEIDLKRENKIRSMFNVSENIIKNRFINSGTKGASMMFHYKILTSYKNEDISALIFYSLINVISKYVNQNRILVKSKKDDLILYDFKAYQRHKIFKLISLIKKQFIKFVEMNGANSRIKFSISVVEHKFYPRDYHKVMKALNQASNEAVAKGREFLFYENQTREEFYFDTSYKTEVSSIIANHSMKYYFMPIIGVTHQDIIGYFSKIVPISTVFNEINEVKDYAYKLSLSKELFSENSKHLISKFVNEAGVHKDTKYLFYSLKYHEIEYANQFLGYVLSTKRANLVLVFDESDLLKNIDKNEDFTEPFRKLHSKGYKLSLNVTLKTLELPDEMYALFDYFQFDVTFFDQNFDDISHSNLTMKRSIEKVLKYHKKVIVSSVETWNDVELRVQENLKLLAGSIISPYSEMILPINKKVIEKIKKIKKRG